MCPLSRHEKDSGRHFRGSLPASTLRNYFVHANFCVHFNSKLSRSIGYWYFTLTQVHRRRKIPQWDPIPPTLDICGTDGQCPSWLLWLMGRHRHFQGAVHLIYFSILLRMKWVMSYNCLFLSTGYRWVKKTGLDGHIHFLRYLHSTRWIQPKASFILQQICQGYNHAFFLHLDNLRSMLFPRFSVTSYSPSRRLGRGGRGELISPVNCLLDSFPLSVHICHLLYYLVFSLKILWSKGYPFIQTIFIDDEGC